MAEADSARLWQKFRLDWNYNSNRIEGNSLTYGETEALLILGTEPKRIEKDIREMKAHDMGIEYLLSLAADERPLGEADIRTLNQIILKENYWIKSETADGNVSEKEIVPGTYKKMPNHVRLRGGGIHKFAEPNEVPMRMATTVKRLRSYLKKQDKPLAEFLAELHQYFIQTHPFDDGNGRVVRMLLNYVCLKLGWPHIIIKDKNKKEYLASLEQWDKGNTADIEAIMKAELIWSLKKSIAAARGEDIDDPDDLDKEIDLFLAEIDDQFEAERTEVEQDNLKMLEVFIKTDHAISSQFEKLQKAFKVFIKEPRQVSHHHEIKLTPEIISQGLSKKYVLDDWRSPRNDYKVDLEMKLFNLNKRPYIRADLKIWRNGTLSSGDGHLKSESNKLFSDGRFVYDPNGKYLSLFSDGNDFVKKLTKAIFDEIKLF